MALATFIASGACGPSPCTPEEFDLGGAPRVTPRDLAGRAPVFDACTDARVEVVRTEADLRRLYEQLASRDADGGTPAAVDLPAVDFSRESVIVREGPANEGISWVVAQGETAVLGLLSCMGPITPSCVVNVIAVPVAVSSAEARKCDAVACGGLQAPPPPGKL